MDGLSKVEIVEVFGVSEVEHLALALGGGLEFGFFLLPAKVQEQLPFDRRKFFDILRGELVFSYKNPDFLENVL